MNRAKTGTTPISARRIATLVGISALVGTLWPIPFTWWSEFGSYQVFAFVYEDLHLKGPSVILFSDVIFALTFATALAAPFVYWIRERVYLAEAIVLTSFLATLFLVLAIRDGRDVKFFASLPALWLFVLFFALAVGEGAKWLRRRAG